MIYVPWSTHAADVLELFRRRKREVAAVVNEFGETIGILTFDDILDTLFSGAPSRSERLLRRDPIRLIAPGSLARDGHDQRAAPGPANSRSKGRRRIASRSPASSRRCSSACRNRATSASGVPSISRSSTSRAAVSC